MARFLENKKEIDKSARKQRKKNQSKSSSNRSNSSQYSTSQDKKLNTIRSNTASSAPKANSKTVSRTNNATRKYSTGTSSRQYTVSNISNRKATEDYLAKRSKPHYQRSAREDKINDTLSKAEVQETPKSLDDKSKDRLKGSNVIKGVKALENRNTSDMGGAQYRVDLGSRREFGERVSDITKGSVKQVIGGHFTSISHQNDRTGYDLEMERITDLYKKGRLNKADYEAEMKSLQEREKQGKKKSEVYESKARAIQAEGDKQVQEGMKGLSGISKIGAEAYNSLIGMGMDMAFTPTGALVGMASRTYGNSLNSVNELVEKGIISAEEAERYAIMQAGKEVITEGAFRGVGAAAGYAGAGKATEKLSLMAKRGIDKVTQRINDNVLKNVVSTGLRLGQGAAEEATEEAIAGLLDAPITNIAYANRLDEEYRGGLKENGTNINSQRDQMMKYGYTRDEATNIFVNEIGGDGFLEELAQQYIDDGMSEKKAFEQANNMQEYMIASLNGDEKTMKSLEDKMAEGIKAKFSLSDTLEAMAAAGLMTTVTGGAGAVGTAIKGEQIKNAFAQVNGADNAAKSITRIAKGLSDKEMAARASAMYDYASQGKELSYEQYVELGNAIAKQRYENAQKAKSAHNVGMETAKKESFFAVPGLGVSSNGNYVFGESYQLPDGKGGYVTIVNSDSVTNKDAEQSRIELYKIADQIENEMGTSIEDKDNFIEELVAAEYGYANEAVVEYLTDAFPENRAIYEMFTGETLPTDNAKMRDAVYQRSTLNFVKTAERETIDTIDRNKGFLDVQFANTIGSEGQQTFQALSDNIGVEDTEKYTHYANVMGKVYEAGRNELPLETVLKFADANQIAEEDAKLMYEAGKADGINPNQPTVKFDISKGTAIRNSHRDTLLAFSRIFGVNIVVTDKLTVDKANKIKNKQSIEESDNVGAQVNGMFYDNTIYINLNDDIRKPIGYTIMHELTHGIKQMFPEDYSTFAELFKERWIAKNGEESFSKAIQGKIKTYADNNVSLSEADALEEIICDQMAEVLYDEQFMQNIAENHPSLAQSLLYAIQDVIRKIRQLFANYGGFRSEFNEATLSQLDMLKDAEALLMKAIQAAQEGRTKEILDEGSKYSFEDDFLDWVLDDYYEIVEDNASIPVRNTAQVLDIRSKEDLLDVSEDDIRELRRNDDYETLGEICEILYTEKEIEAFKKEAEEDYEELNWIDLSDIEERFADFKEFEEPSIRRVLNRPESQNYENNGKQVAFTSERIERLISAYSYGGNKSSAYVTRIHPRDFLKLTLPDSAFDEWNNNVGGKVWGTDINTLDIEKLKNEKQTPYLTVDMDNRFVTGHEGRHRMRALLEAGFTSVPIVVECIDSNGYRMKGEKDVVDNLEISSQSFSSHDGPVNDNYTTTIRNLVPVNEMNKQNIEEAYGNSGADLRFSIDSEGNNLSSQQAAADEAYRNAVNNADMRKAQQMVDDAAQRAGYKKLRFHETKPENDIHVFTTDNAVNASGDPSTPYGIFTKRTDAPIGLGGKQMKLWVKAENTFKVKDRDSLSDALPEEYSNFISEIEGLVGKYSDRLDNLEDEFFIALDEWLDAQEDGDSLRDAWDVTKRLAEQDFADRIPGEIIEAEEKYNRLMEEWKYEEESLISDSKEWMTSWLRDNGYDSMELAIDAGSGGRSTDALIVLDANQVKSADPVTYDDNGDVIPLSKRFDSTSSDVRFSIDSEGNELSLQQSEYFKDSKVRDEDGNLLVMYHGTKADFTVFDKNYIGGTGRFEGAGFNFTSFEGRAMSYDTSGEGKVFRTYLNIKNPLSDSERTITKSKLKKIVSGIAQREDIEGYDSIIFAVTAPYGKNIDEDYNRSLADTVDYLWRSCKTDADIYSQISTLGTNDEVVIDEFEKEGFDGLIWHDDGTISTVIAFEPEQIKSVDNKQPTLNPDIRFSVSSEIESELYKPAAEDATSAPDVKFSFGKEGTFYGKQAQSNTGSNPTGNAKIDRKTRKAVLKSGEEVLRATMAKNIKARLANEGYKGRKHSKFVKETIEKETRVVLDFFKEMNDMFEEMTNGDLYTFVGLKQVHNASVSVRRDENGNIIGVAMSAMVQNGEYQVNFDFTTICKKRQAFNAIIEKLTKESGRDVALTLSPEQLMEINQALRKEGVETACLGCFVESRRYHMQSYTTKVLETWNSIVDEEAMAQGIPLDSIEDFGFSDDEVTEKDYLNAAGTFLDYENTKSDDEEVSKQNPAGRFRQIIRSSNGTYLKHLRASDLVTPKGIAAIRELGSTADKDLLGMFKSAYGVAAPKETIAYTPYNHEIAKLPNSRDKKSYAEYLKSIGGARMQSFSDFLIANTFDYMQMVADLSARGFPAHAYTKEIAFARIFGMTGIKINLSVMFDVNNADYWGEAFGITDKEQKIAIAKKYAGLQFFKSKEDIPESLREHSTEVTENGVTGYITFLVSDKERADREWNSDFEREFANNGGDEIAAREYANNRRRWTQSIGFADAVKLQKEKGYSANCGIIGVGLSDQNILLMLDDEDFPYVIPYHASGLPDVIKVLTNLSYATNYEDTQNTRIFVKATKADGTTITHEELKAMREQYASWREVFVELGEDVKFEGRREQKGEKNKDGENYTLAGTGGFDFYKYLDEGMHPREISEKYLEYCAEYGLLPVFPQFAGHKNYYKLLIDFNVMDLENNTPSPQRAVRNNYPGVDVDAPYAEGQTSKDYSRLKEIIQDEALEIQKQNQKRDEVVDKIVKSKTENKMQFSISDNQALVPLAEVIPSKESVIQYSINNPLDTSWFDGILDDEEANARGDKNKSISEITAEFTNIVRDNAKLTGGKVLDRKSIKKQIGELVKMTTKDTTYTATEKREIAGFLMDTAEQIWSITGEKRPMRLKQEEIDRIINLLYEASDYVISNAQYLNDSMLNEIIEFKKFFRGRKIGVSAGARAELADDWDTIRKRNFGRVRFVSAEKYGNTNIADALYEAFQEAPETSLLYGREAMEAMEIGDEATLVRILDDVLSNLSVVDDAIKSEYAEDFRVALSQDFARIVLNEGEAWNSKMDRFKDRYEQRIKDLRARQKEAVRDLRSNYEKLLAEQNATFKKKLAEAKAKSEERLQAEKDKQKAKEQKRKDSEQHKKIWNRIAEDYNWLAQRLVKPKKDDFKHIPSDFVESVANLLEIFDFQTERSLQLEEKRGYASEPTKAMRELRDKISKYSSPDGGSIFVKNDALDVLVDECIEFLDGRALRELEDYELQKISEMLRAVRHMVKTQNELFVANRKATVAEAGEGIISESAEKMQKYGRRYDRTGISGKLSHLLNETMMSPGNFFDSLGGTMKTLYKNLRNAQDDYIRKIDFLRNFHTELLKPYYKKAKPGSVVEDWQTKANEFTLSDGSQLKMTVAQVMSLYCLSKRKQALEHICGSGIVLSDVSMDRGIAKVLGGKVQNTASGYRMTYNDMMNVISSLTDEQRKIADSIQNLMNTTLKDWGNETSLRLFDMEFFTEENYFPIAVEQSELATEVGKGTEIKGNRITSFGMTKPLTQHANNRIVIGDIFSISADHCNKMALYSAYAPSLIDFNRVYNYKQRNEDGTTGYSVKGMIKDAYSNKALKFIDNILDDINGQAQPRTDGLTAMTNAALANYKKAAIGLNVRVLVQQPTAIMRSLYMINPRYFTPDCFIGLKKAREEMHTHCPIAAWKAWGNYQNDYTKSLEDVMLNKDWSKLDVVTMRMYGWTDDNTWAVIWNAVKNEVKQKNPNIEVGSEEYWNLCNERASEIYDETQVVDSVFHRSDAMRSPNGFAKLFTSFMAEPTRTYNMVRSSLVKAYRSHKDGDNKAAASELNKMLVVVILNAAAVSAAAAVVDAFRGKGDDDDEETWLETFYRNFGENFKDNVNMLHNIVFVKDVASLFENAVEGKYFSPSNMVLEGWYKLAKGTADYKKVLSGDKSFIEWISGDFGAGIGYVTGIPTATFIRDAKALWSRLSLPTFASDGVEEDTPSLWDYENNPLEVTDGTWADNVLNFFGINLTPEERAERDFKRTLKEVENKTKDLSGAEKKEAVNKMVMDGYTQYVEDGDYAKLKQMRRIIEATGGDVEVFDEKVAKRTASEYKKTIGVEGTGQKQAEMRQFLLENGWTEAKISGEIIYKSNTAKDFKAACREMDLEKATDVLTKLYIAGLTEQDAYKLWQNRNRGSFDTYSTGNLIAPTSGTITSRYGYRKSPTAGASSYHQGIDIGAPRGTVVSAADGGTVVYVGYNGGYGNQIVIQHDDGTQTYYSHLDHISVRKGQSVSQKQYIGNVGSTGTSTGPHLDFRVRVNGSFVDPMKYINA